MPKTRSSRFDDQQNSPKRKIARSNQRYLSSLQAVLFAVGIQLLELTLPTLVVSTTVSATIPLINADWAVAYEDSFLVGRSDDENAGFGSVLVAAASLSDFASLLDLDELAFQGLPMVSNKQDNNTALTADALSASRSTFRKTKAIVKSKNNEQSQTILWHGVEWSDTALDNDEIAPTDGIGFATLVQDTATGQICGTLTTRTTTYALVTTAFGSLEARAVHWKDHPRDEHDVDDGNDSSGLGGRSDTRGSPFPTDDSNVVSFQFPFSDFTSGGSTIEVFDGPAVNITFDSIENDDNFNNNTKRVLRERQLPESNDDGREEVAIIDILVIVTNRAMCEYAGVAAGCDATLTTYTDPIVLKIELLEAEFNNAMELDKITNVKVRVVDIRILPAVTSDNEIYTQTETLTFMDSSALLQEWRTQVYADMVILIASANPARLSCGRGQLKGVNAVTSYECLEAYSWTHEVGHLLGCRHNLEDTASPETHPYAYGYRKFGKFRTVMSYECDDNGIESDMCPRIPIFSAATVDYRPYGKIGNSEQDNRRMIIESAPAVAARMNPPTPAPTTIPDDPVTRDAPMNGQACGKDETGTCSSGNLMHGTVFFLFCFTGCIDQSIVWMFQLFGWSCGGGCGSG